MRVFDCVLVTSPADLGLLEARFTEYEDIPDVTVVIAEAETGYDGQAKPLHFKESPLWGQRRGRWNHVHVHAAELPAGAGPRVRKDALRNWLAQGVNGQPGDLVMHGGVDEIPSAQTVRGLIEREWSVPVGMEMRWACYQPGLVHPKGPWRGTVVQEWRNVGSFAGMRDKRATLPAIVGAGTRLSAWGEQVPGDRMHPDGHALWDAAVDESWPRRIRERAAASSDGT